MQRIDSIQTEFKNQIEGITEPWKCPQCDGTETQYTLQIIPTGKPDAYFPKWIPQIKETCSNCGRYKRFCPQSELVVTRFNERLSTIQVRAKNGDV